MTDTLQRPQPIGIFPPPAAFLLLPAVSNFDALAGLLRGEVSANLPAEWKFFAAAVEGRMEDAKQMLRAGDSLLSEYNLFVLEGGEAQRYQRLHGRLPAGLSVLLEVAAFQFGLVDELPNPDLVDGELSAAVLLARASGHLEGQATALAIADLEKAVECARNISPVFAAQLLGQLAALRGNTAGHDAEHVMANYRDALELAADTPLDGLRAELWVNLGTCYQEHSGGRRDLLTQAIQAYQQAVRCGLSGTHFPELYALAQNNLGLAYLTMPMVEASDTLRKAVAVQSFREALKVYQADTHRLEWVSAKLNLANALQHLPSSHPEENLAQSVEIYEELLQARNRAEDPVGYARLLANQANALAHLGLFSQSLEKANEAYKLFHWHNETGAANSVLELVASVHENLGNKQAAG